MMWKSSVVSVIILVTAIGLPRTGANGNIKIAHNNEPIKQNT